MFRMTTSPGERVGARNLFDVEEEGFAVDRPIGHPRRINPVVAQRGDEGQGLPMAVGA